MWHIRESKEVPHLSAKQTDIEIRHKASPVKLLQSAISKDFSC